MLLNQVLDLPIEIPEIPIDLPDIPSVDMIDLPISEILANEEIKKLVEQFDLIQKDIRFIAIVLYILLFVILSVMSIKLMSNFLSSFIN